MNIILSIASRGRPEQLMRCLEQWTKRALHDVHLELGIDADDPRADDYHRLLMPGTPLPPPEPSARPRTKVEAINETLRRAGALSPDWEIAVIAADDMIPIVDGWDACINAQAQGDPNRIYWFDDGRQNIRCTIPVIGRAWYEARGYVYHPSYKAYYCDDEQTQQAMEAGELVRIMGPMFLHNHACFGAAPNDATYQRNRKYKEEDRRNFQIRKQHSWPAENPTAHLK